MLRLLINEPERCEKAEDMDINNDEYVIDMIPLSPSITGYDAALLDGGFGADELVMLSKNQSRLSLNFFNLKKLVFPLASCDIAKYYYEQNVYRICSLMFHRCEETVQLPKRTT